MLGTAVLLPMLGVSAAAGAVGTYLWIALHLHGKVPQGYLLTSFALQGGAAFATGMILRKLSLLNSQPDIIPIGELREG